MAFFDEDRALLFGRYILLIFWIGLPLYFGVGGMTRVDNVRLMREAASQPEDKIEYHKTFYRNLDALKADLEIQKEEKLFPHNSNLPEFVALTMTAVAFGALGGAARSVKLIVIDGESIQNVSTSLLATLGAMQGLMILGISYILPIALTENQDLEIRPMTLLFLCLFAGVFSVRVHAWFESQMARIFPSPTSN